MLSGVLFTKHFYFIQLGNEYGIKKNKIIGTEVVLTNRRIYIFAQRYQIKFSALLMSKQLLCRYPTGKACHNKANADGKVP